MKAGSKFFAILCNNAVVELVLNKPNALRRNPCDRHASTAATEVQTQYFVTIIFKCFFFLYYKCIGLKPELSKYLILCRYNCYYLHVCECI